MNNKPLDEDEILAIIASELARANYSTTDQGYGQLEESMSYYLGLPNGTEVDGRSTVTSTDVADAIEWIMPQIMESFTQVNEIVKFDPVGPDDVRQAEIESQFVYDILMKENDGFILIYELVKDALMQRNGVLKVFYEHDTSTVRKQFTGLTQEAMAVLSQAVPNMQVTGVDQYVDQSGQPLFNIAVEFEKNSGNVVVNSVPLEEFRVNAQHNSVNLKHARFTAHVVTKTLSELSEMGYAEEVLDKLPAYHNFRRDYRWSMMHENSTGALVQSADESQKFVQVHECCMMLDIERTGIARLMKITCAGSTDVPEVILDMEDLDSQPWVSTTPIIMPHKFQGLSITDRLKQIQDHKTAIWRNILDNMYLQNNQRNVVVEGAVNMDDLLVSRPGGIIRAKRLDAITPLQTPQISNVAFDMMRYLDEVRAGRSGVQADGNASPQAIGDRVGSEGVDRLLNAKEALVGLIIRTIAETGIKPLMVKIRDLATKHFDTVQDYQYHDEWVKLAPQSWISKRNCTVRVGTGTGDTQQKLTVLQSILQYQVNAIQNPQQSLVDQGNIYSTLDDICKLGGLNGASKYFIDPNSPNGQQKQAQVGQQAAQQATEQKQAQVMQLQNEAKLAESTIIAANAQAKAAEYRGQAEQLKHQVAMLKEQLAQFQLGADSASKDDELQFKYDKLKLDTALKLTEIEAQAKADENASFTQNRGMLNG